MMATGDAFPLRGLFAPSAAKEKSTVTVDLELFVSRALESIDSRTNNREAEFYS